MIYIDKVERDLKLELCKVNREVIGVIDSKFIDSIKVNLGEINSIDIRVPKIIKNKMNPIYNLCKNERLLCLNDNKYFVLKNDAFRSSDSEKVFKAYSLEYKLNKMDIIVEDIAFCLISKDEDNDIYSLNDYMKSETGWSFGYIEDSVRYDIDEEGNKVDKLRWQESVNMRWYDYLTKDICESFNCITFFNTHNKTIDLYDVNSFGENVELYLSRDNYVNSMERDTDSVDIVTRLHLVGNEEMDVISATPTGYNFIEDYSYFIENEEMSSELITALNKYYEMVDIRSVIWKNLVDEKNNKSTILYDKKMQLFVIYEDIKAKKMIKEQYNISKDDINEAKIIAEITKLIDQQVILEVEIKNLENDITLLDESIFDINLLCKYETATDENGLLIFSEELLYELKDFIYSDTYTNDSFLNVEDLISAGERMLNIKCRPTVSYSLDLDNFIKNIRSNGFNSHFNGNIGLGDIVILYDDDREEEVYLYVNGYEQKPNGDKEIYINLSNKKIPNSDIRLIGDSLKMAELNNRFLNRKSHLLNKQKYNRLNITKNIENNGL